MLHTELIVFFSHAILWGLKTPANHFYLTGERRKMMTCCFVFGRFKKWRAFCALQFSVLLFVIIFVSQYTYKRAQVVGMVKCVGYASLGPGFDSQVPQRLVNIFSNMFLCSLPNNKHHMPSCISVPCVLSHKSNGPEVLTTMLPSQ